MSVGNPAPTSLPTEDARFVSDMVQFVDKNSHAKQYCLEQQTQMRKKKIESQMALRKKDISPKNVDPPDDLGIQII